jgi:hypothetical protein
MWVSRADARRIPDNERSEEERRMSVRCCYSSGNLILFPSLWTAREILLTSISEQPHWKK